AFPTRRSSDLIFFVTARNNDGVARRARLDFLEGLLIARENFLRHREALFVGERFAIVHHRNTKARRMRCSCHRHRNVPAAEQIRHRLRARFDGGGKRDRKSTRLNSSHRTISYAVFCLKKKKKNTCKTNNN